MSSPRISEAEWEVMEVVWRRNPITSVEVIDALKGEHGWAANTVRTMLARLIRKGALRCAREKGRHLYGPAVPRERCVKQEVNSLLDRVFGGAVQPALLFFVRNKKLSRAEIRQLRAMLDEHEEK